MHDAAGAKYFRTRASALPRPEVKSRWRDKVALGRQDIPAPASAIKGPKVSGEHTMKAILC